MADPKTPTPPQQFPQPSPEMIKRANQFAASAKASAAAMRKQLDVASLDQALLVVMLYSDKAMTFFATSATRSYPIDSLVTAAAAGGDATAKLTDAGSMRQVLRTLVMRALVSETAGSVKLTPAGVLLAKAYAMNSALQPVVNALA